MNPKQPGNKKLPDFDKLNDRIIAERPSEPMLVIKTNLDSKNVKEENPYYHGENTKEFQEFFDE
ncbi:hypothetical protein E2K98_00630 [Bacillus salipaludis]|uniref:Uncharacterized protein n=1 Tax=Bacillus salipaludis TaxID=2547811 RepID=A0A4R5W138_9BACI|nr:hypothetical protein [Bacillus salipaludis]MDQ6597008.1 hypothetical protein [Bacillus salipaludis]TDK64784.1 hypothetical protein E2K98_00630 [Bacillus salipaludis]